MNQCKKMKMEIQSDSRESTGGIVSIYKVVNGSGLKEDTGEAGFRTGYGLLEIPQLRRDQGCDSIIGPAVVPAGLAGSPFGQGRHYQVTYYILRKVGR